MRYHLAILTQPWLDLILDGKKTIESRFTKIRCAPYGKVYAGNLVYLKESGGPIKGQFTVSKVETYTDLTSEILHKINGRYHRHIFVDPQFQGFWKKWTASKYATLLHVDDVVAYRNPVPFPKKDGRAWVLLDKPLIAD